MPTSHIDSATTNPTITDFEVSSYYFVTTTLGD